MNTAKDKSAKPGGAALNNDMVIRPTALGGWKGSAIMALVCLLFMVFPLIQGNVKEVLLFLVAAAGWFGWALQEYLHLMGYRIEQDG